MCCGSSCACGTQTQSAKSLWQQTMIKCIPGMYLVCNRRGSLTEELLNIFAIPSFFFTIPGWIVCLAHDIVTRVTYAFGFSLLVFGWEVYSSSCYLETWKTYIQGVKTHKVFQTRRTRGPCQSLPLEQRCLERNTRFGWTTLNAMNHANVCPRTMFFRVNIVRRIYTYYNT